MRTTFIKTLTELAGEDQRIIFLTGDLGYMVVDDFVQNYGDRFFNAGVAEQNMVGMAAGLAEAGFLPFVYSIATFAALRPYEFIRNDAILHRFPVRIVGVGGGFEYGYNGPTHYGIEDVGVMRIQAGITTIVPADFEQTRSALLATYDLPQPIYYRLGKDEKTVIPGLKGDFALGKANIVRQGDDILLLAMGSIASEAVRAADELANKGISAEVMTVSSFNPSPVEDLLDTISNFKLAVSVEEHYINGGLGSLTAEVIAENQLDCRLIRCGLREAPNGITGSYQFMKEHHQISAEALAATMMKALQ